MHYKVGGGGGHSLTIQNAVLKLESNDSSEINKDKVKQDKISVETKIPINEEIALDELQDNDVISIQSLSNLMFVEYCEPA